MRSLMRWVVSRHPEKKRSFKTSTAVLNLGARNNNVKSRWLNLLGALSKYKSNVPKQDGDVAIVNALVKNLAAKAPLPVYFTSHAIEVVTGYGLREYTLLVRKASSSAY